MNYSILIELSRQTISFSYSRDDGKNQFIPYGDELVKPLAIYSSGNELRIGRFAAEEARAGRAGAFDNIFDAIKRPASFTYRGTQYPLNKLLLFGIEHCLREFFDSILYGTEGQLEQNTAKVPICLLMSSELNDNEQAYVISLLKNAGYSNTFSIDYNTKVLDYTRASLAKKIEKAIFVSTIGNDLFVECIDARDAQQPKRLFDLNAKEAGKNPQIDQVVKLIWQDIVRDENSINLVFDECLPEMQSHALSFLASGAPMCQNMITFKDHSYEYFITKSSISNGMIGNDNALGNLLFELKSKGVESTKSTIILLKSTSKNAYVRQSFCDSFPFVVNFDEEKHQEMLNSILEFVKKSNYKFPQVPVPPPIPVAEKTPENNQNVKDVIRKAKMLLRSYKNRTDKAEIVKEMKELMEPLQQNGQNDIANELEKVIEKIRVEAPKPPIINKNNIKFKREVGILCNSVKHMNFNEAIKKIDDLLKRLHDEGISEYDKRLESLRTNLKPTPPPIPKPKQAPKVEPVKAPSPSPSEISKLKREAKMAIHKSGISKKELTDLLDKLHSIGLHDYDTDLNVAIKKI